MTTAGLRGAYTHLRGVLSPADIDFLAAACKKRLSAEGIPCYSLIDHLAAPPIRRIREALERLIGADLYYLNDFYLYTDGTSAANWHVDTELFTFESAVNAWILLSPDAVDDPLGFIDDMNVSPDRFYHSVSIRNGECTFADCFSGHFELRSLDEVEAAKLHTPRVQVGDILVINPKRFHKTNAGTPKHCVAIKFLIRGANGFLSGAQVPADLWPEVAIFNRLVAGATEWEDVVAGIRRALETPAGRRELTAGFFPERFDLFKEMVATL